MKPPVIHRVSALDLAVEPWAWPFAEARRAEIAAHFADKQREKPAMWNGRVLLGRNPVFAGDRLSASYFETDFASFLAWRDWGFPDQAVFNGFGMGALRCADGAFVLGEMGQHTANAGRIYFPSGTPDLDDIRDGALDISGSVAREARGGDRPCARRIRERAGLALHLHRACARDDPHAAASICRATALRERIEANLAAQRQPELSAIHLVRGAQRSHRRNAAFCHGLLEAQLQPNSAFGLRPRLRASPQAMRLTSGRATNVIGANKNKKRNAQK